MRATPGKRLPVPRPSRRAYKPATSIFRVTDRARTLILPRQYPRIPLVKKNSRMQNRSLLVEGGALLLLVPYRRHFRRSGTFPRNGSFPLKRARLHLHRSAVYPVFPGRQAQRPGDYGELRLFGEIYVHIVSRTHTGFLHSASRLRREQPSLTLRRNHRVPLFLFINNSMSDYVNE